MIKLVIFDFDGCFTDGLLDHTLINAKDTYGLQKLKDQGVKTAIISRMKGDIEHRLLRERMDYIFTNSTDKLTTAKKLLKELNLQFSEVAFMGDDEPDLELLELCEISACPGDAVPPVREKVKFLSAYQGGRGAVREFSEFILKHNERHQKPVVAVIGVRSGSQRTKNKCVRDFGRGENLLVKKLRTLSQVKEIDKIIVSSDSDEYLKLAGNFENVELDKRNEYYASSKISGKQLFEYLGGLIPDDSVFLYSPVVAPFLRAEDYSNAIAAWKKDINYDSVITTSELKEFIWYNNKPLNYDYDNAPNSQDLPPYKVPSLGICLIEKENLLEKKNVIGSKPLMLDVNKLKATDIDDVYDFAVAKLLNENYILDMNSLNKYLDKGKVSLIDCSVRDGGHRNNWEFTDKEVAQMYEAVSDSLVEYFEIGFRSPKIDGGGKWLYSSDKDIQKIKNTYSGKTPAKIAVMFKYGEYDLEDIHENSPIDLYRIRVKSKEYTEEHNSFIAESIKKVNALQKEVSLNIPYGHLLDDELNELITHLFESGAKIDVFYIADTFGSMTEKLVIESFNTLYKFVKQYNDNPVFGFHTHNNNNDALYRSLYAIDKFHYVSYIDSCINGLGRGKGNMKTEDVLLKLNTLYHKNYKFRPLYELVFNEFDKEAILYKLSADYCVHPDKVPDLLAKNLCFKECLNALSGTVASVHQ